MPDVLRHLENAEGPFYVERDCCISCEAPYYEAPDLMGRPYSSANDPGCFFRRQPETADEIGRACRAVCVSCVAAVRYAGDDEEILGKLYELGAYDSCDVGKHPRSREEQLVIHAVKRRGGWFRNPVINWTYVRAEEDERIVVAICFAWKRHHPRRLEIFAINQLTSVVFQISDDAPYRPKHDVFVSQQSGLSRLFRWLRRW